MSGTSILKSTDDHRKSDLTSRLLYQLSRHWVAVFALVFGLYAGVPFLAPVLMRGGWVGPAKTIYLIYSFLCHQLPERSYFLFGYKLTYSMGEIQAAWVNTLDPVILRQFIGNPVMGWKVAWSDRMVSMFTSTLLFGLSWSLLRRMLGDKLPSLPWWGLILFLLPMTVDGTTHFFSDLFGIGQGFRDSNLWLAALTHHAYPLSFYAGDGWGSFNSMMRLLTGVLFGLGVVWFSFPYLDETFTEMARWLGLRMSKTGG